MHEIPHQQIFHQIESTLHDLQERLLSRAWRRKQRTTSGGQAAPEHGFLLTFIIAAITFGILLSGIGLLAGAIAGLNTSAAFTGAAAGWIAGFVVGLIVAARGKG